MNKNSSCERQVSPHLGDIFTARGYVFVSLSRNKAQQRRDSAPCRASLSCPPGAGKPGVGAVAAGSTRFAAPPPGSAAESDSGPGPSAPTGPAGPPPPPHSWRRTPPQCHRTGPNRKHRVSLCIGLQNVMVMIHSTTTVTYGDNQLTNRKQSLDTLPDSLDSRQKPSNLLI